MDKMRNMKLRYRILLMSLLIMLIGNTTIFFSTYYTMKNPIVNILEESELDALNNAGNFMESWLQLHENNIDNIINGLKVFNSTSLAEKESLLKTYAKLYEDFEYYAGYANGDYLDGSGWQPDSDYVATERGWYVDAIDTDTHVISEPYVDAMDGDVIVSVSKRISDRGKDKGVVASDIRFSNMEEALKGVDVGKDSYLIVTDKSGNILIHPNSEYHPTPDGMTNINDVLGMDIISDQYDNFEHRDSYDGISRYFMKTKIESTGWYLFLAKPSSTISNVMSGTIKSGLIVFIIISTIMGSASLIFGNRIAKPIEEGTLIASEIANFNLGVNIPDDLCNDIDEIGIMYSSYRTILDNLRGFSALLNQSVNDVNILTSDASNDIGDLTKQAERTFDIIESLSASMEEMVATTSLVGENTQEVTNTVSGFANAVREGYDISKEVSNRGVILEKDFEKSKSEYETKFVEIKDNMQMAVRNSEKIKNIQSLSNLINNVASQTELLSLNATIEAARAGEAGRGFSVVASEIGKLSDATQNAVREINDETNEVIKLVADLVKITEESIHFVEETVGQDYNKMIEALGQYSTDGNIINEKMLSINSITEDFSERLRTINISLNEIVTVVDDTSEGILNVAHQTKDISTLSGNVNHKLIETTKVSRTLEEVANRLK